MTTVGPALEITRRLQQPGPAAVGGVRRRLVVGAGHEGPARGRPDGTGTTATQVVTYPDGEQVAFGLNPGGRVHPAAGPVRDPGPGLGRRVHADRQERHDLHVHPVARLRRVRDHVDHRRAGAHRDVHLHRQRDHQDRPRRRAAVADLTWSTPSGAAYPHVASVVTDDATAGNSSTAITWNYHYSGDDLSAACPPASTDRRAPPTATRPGRTTRPRCWTPGRTSYWRLDETSGAARRQLGAGQRGRRQRHLHRGDARPGRRAAGRVVGAPRRPSTGPSYVTLPAEPGVTAAAYQTVSLWFKTSSPNGVLFVVCQTRRSARDSTTANCTPRLYIGSDGKLEAEFWTGHATDDVVDGGGRRRPVAQRRADRSGSGQPDPVPRRGAGRDASPARCDRRSEPTTTSAPGSSAAAGPTRRTPAAAPAAYLLQRRHLGRGVLGPAADRRRGLDAVRGRDPPRRRC